MNVRSVEIRRYRKALKPVASVRPAAGVNVKLKAIYIQNRAKELEMKNKFFKLENSSARVFKCKTCGYEAPYQGEDGKVICPTCRINLGIENEMEIKPTGLHVDVF